MAQMVALASGAQFRYCFWWGCKQGWAGMCWSGVLVVLVLLVVVLMLPLVALPPTHLISGTGGPHSWRH